MKPTFNYYRASFEVMTARRAKINGIAVSIPYGYYVIISKPYLPPTGHHGKRPGSERVESWCATKTIAENKIKDLQLSQQKGYFGCQCGSDKQARACCGFEKQKDMI